jgi:hypothetical protein
MLQECLESLSYASATYLTMFKFLGCLRISCEHAC